MTHMPTEEARQLVLDTVAKATDYPYITNPDARALTLTADTESVATAQLRTAALAMKESANDYEKGNYTETILRVLGFAIFALSQAPILLESGVLDREQFEYLLQHGDKE